MTEALTQSLRRVRRQGPAVLLNAKTDLDAPTFQDLAFIKNKGHHQSSLKAQNQRLKSQVRGARLRYAKGVLRRAFWCRVIES